MSVYSVSAQLDAYVCPPAGLVRAGCLSGFPAAMARCGGDVQRALETVGLRATALDSPANLMSFDCYAKLLSVAADQTGRQDFGFILGETSDIRDIGPTGYLFHYAGNWGQAFTDFCKYFPNIQDNAIVSFEVQDGVARLSYDLKMDSLPQHKQECAFTMSLLNSTVLSLALYDVVERIDFQPHVCRGAEPVAIYDKLRMAQPMNAIYLPAAFLETRTAGSDRFIHDLITGELKKEARFLVQQAGLLAEVRGFVIRHARKGASRMATLQALAKHLGMSERSVHRHLSEHGTNFRNVKNGILAEIAIEQLLDGRRPIAEIALELGFSEQSAFSRAFKAETGLTPDQIRQGIHPIQR